MNRKPLRSSLLGGLLAFLLLLGVWIFAALHLTSAAASPLEFPFNLQSGLDADYQADALGARIYELRLSIVQGLGAGAGGPQSDALPDSLKEMMSQPVPSATPRPTSTEPSQPETEVPTTPVASETPTATDVPTEAPSETPPPTSTPSPTPTPGAAALAQPDLECSKLSITGVWIDSGGQVRAQVRNNNGSRAYLTQTSFEWPDVPSPAYVDWMEFSRRYYNQDDYSSPTTSTNSVGEGLSVHSNSSRTWTVDFDDGPAEGLYGGFKVSLTLEYPGWGPCVIEGFTYRAQPPTLTPSLTKTPTLTKTPSPTRTPTPANTATTPTALASSSPTDIPAPTQVPSESPVPSTEPPAATATP